MSAPSAPAASSPSGSAPDARARLPHLGPGWFSIVMGLCGLALALAAGMPAAGPVLGVASLAVGGAAAAVFLLLGAATMLRALRHGAAVQQDLQHPVAHAFWAAIPVSALLLATLSVRHHGPSVMAGWLWSASAVAQLALTLAVIRRWWRGNQPGGLVWAGITPALFIPVVGNVIVPLAGVPLGQPEWSAAQFGMGLLFWPVVLVLIMVRKATSGLWPERLLPTAFIHVAPPAVMGVSLLQFGAPPLLAWGARAWRCSCCCGPAPSGGASSPCPSASRTGRCPFRWRPSPR